MSTAGKCSECGAELPADHGLRGLCPRCLLVLGLGVDDTADPKTIGAYEIERLLGRGGMGVVYKARQVSLNRIVALKILNPTLSSDPAFVKRFHREAQAVARLNHQNIVHIYDIGEENGMHFFSMEYVKGRLLSEILDKEGFLRVGQAVDIIFQVARALRYAHSKNIIHRDVKPSNIIVDRLSRVKVMDFGLAKLGGNTRLTRTDTVLGTVKYMSPEQARGETVDHRTDIWSMGIVLYEMLAGMTPFKATNEAALIHKIIYEPVPDLNDLSPETPPQLRAIVAKTMAKDKNERYQSVSDFLKDLQTLKAPRPTKGDTLFEKAGGYLEKLIAFSRKKDVRRKVLVPLALAAVIFVGYLAYSKWSEQRGPAPEDMVLIPAGEFMMGASPGMVHQHETPQHRVFLDAFYIDKFPVTNMQFQKFVDSTGYVTDAEKRGWSNAPEEKRADQIKANGANWRHPRGPESDIKDIMNHPVVHVSWNDAHAYAKWANKRLPTEAEWEKAARGTDGRKYPWGDGEPDGTRCNYADRNTAFGWRDSSVDDGYEYTSPVGRYENGKSPYGIYDMAGNVWEWCSDWYDKDYFSKSPKDNPKGPANGQHRVIRGGGSWHDGADYMRSTNRGPRQPAFVSSDQGFRCAKGVPGAKVTEVAANFDDGLPAGWALYGTAAVENGQIVLTPNLHNQAGSIFYNTPVPHCSHFEVSFDFEIVGFADGFAFAWVPGPEFIGGDGADLGYETLQGYAVEFDVYCDRNYDPPRSHIALIKDDVRRHLASSMDFPTLNNSGKFSCNIVFLNSTIRVYLSNPQAGLAEKKLVLEHTISDYEPFTAYLGLTGATGGVSARHVIDNVRMSAPFQATRKRLKGEKKSGERKMTSQKTETMDTHAHPQLARAKRLAEEEKWDEALTAYTQLADQHPENIELQKAVVLFLHNEYRIGKKLEWASAPFRSFSKTMRRYAERVIKLDPSQRDMYYFGLRGYEYAGLPISETVKRQLENNYARTRQRFPDWQGVFGMYTEAFSNLGLYDLALGVTDDWENQSGESAGVLVNRSRALDGLGRHEEAYQLALSAFNKFPDDAWLAAHLADMQLARGNKSRAIELYKKADEISPNDHFKQKIREISRQQTGTSPPEKTALSNEDHAAPGADDDIAFWTQPSKELLEKLEEPVSFEFANEQAGDVIRFLSSIKQITIEAEPRLKRRRVTIRVDQKRLGEAIELIARMLHSKIQLRSHFIYIGEALYHPDISTFSPGLRAELRQPCTFDFEEQELSKILLLLSSITHGIDFSTSEEIGRRKTSVTAVKLSAFESLQILCSQHDLTLEQDGENSLILQGGTNSIKAPRKLTESQAEEWPEIKVVSVFDPKQSGNYVCIIEMNGRRRFVKEGDEFSDLRVLRIDGTENCITASHPSLGERTFCE